ncbi:hypothetical protein QJS83_05345 [Bdellovibrio sp. 22V]|uniref:hypothetical protein n=1 Tax=Bdellovibrio sp. 22V TaxID=3044166 RepID=UPI0025433A45|nr:hypothetical protein [Bdellovibrio sp. 22V]WII73293.1 hypothetical protein QJS83_05345 [Bdellovibrio sp. 22V]
MELGQEPQREPREPRRQPPRGISQPPTEPARPEPSRPRPYQGKPTETLLPVERTYVQETCVVLGTALLIYGLLGFVIDNLFRAHLSYTVNALHFASGALSLWFGFDNEVNARRFSWVAGVFYGLFGLIGFIAGRPGMPTVGAIREDQFLWKAIPGVIEQGTADHLIHLLICGAFILGATLKFRRFQKL